MSSGIPNVTVLTGPFVKAFRADESTPMGEVLTIEEAFARTYKTDAHMVSYVPVDGPAVRLMKEGARPERGGVPVSYVTTVLVVDVDNEGHAVWTPEAFAEWLAWYPTVPVLATCGVYATRGGWRIVQPLETPIPSHEVEPYILAFHEELLKSGIQADPSCKDWTRLMRLPNVWRRTGPYVSPHVSLERMRPRAIVPVQPANRPWAGAAKARRSCPSRSACLRSARQLDRPRAGRRAHGRHGRRCEQFSQART